jgi:hypothetical protein
MDFTQPIDFVEAIQHLAAKHLLPTSLDSAALKQIDAGIRRQALFSAQTLQTDLLQKYKDVVGSIINPVQVKREGQDQTVTEGMNPATAHEAILNLLKEQGYQATPGEEGTIKDLSSDKRIKLVIDTNVQLAQGAGSFVQQNSDEDVVDLYPALELYRLEEKDKPRDWEHRWMIAAQVARDPRAAAALEFKGRMVALKSSGIWQALGDGAGGYQDTLGNPYPPFAFNSGMWTEDVSRDDAVELGLIGAQEDAKPAAFDLASLFKEAA